MQIRCALLSLAPLFTAGALLGIGQTAGATGVADDFESYATGSFPSPTWSDVAVFSQGPPAPTLPSVTVETTTDAFGNATKALAVTDQVALISGIYQAVPISANYSLEADIRIDRYSNNAQLSTSDWAMQLTFSQLQGGIHASSPQVGIYASSLTRGWRVFLLDTSETLFADIDLGLPAAVGTWYRVGFDLDAVSGAYHARVTDIASNTVLVDQSDNFGPGWTAASGLFDSVSFFDGEGSPEATIGNLSVVDNVNVQAVAEPSSSVLASLAALSLVGYTWRRRAMLRQ